MAYELDCWTAFKAALQADTTLSAYVKTWRLFRTAQIFQPIQHPVLMAWPESIPSDAYISFPKRKKVELNIVLTGIVQGVGDAVEDELLHFDAMVKNAMEADIRLGGKATIANCSTSTFRGLSEGVTAFQFVATLTLPFLTAGAR
jgi:hypothetical protein